ncbi:redoxin domain-containing protein [Halosquirtibacter xylanolyticus]|uniref:redoxin domain-containing protein n=1 Tax=Halosquirtibacter xylanolyticus TaxID=3374599 RepID=UPI00374A1E6D|nr:redoxin domain-containing protein [Prolixibacteraceae bacterium]
MRFGRIIIHYLSLSVVFLLVSVSYVTASGIKVHLTGSHDNDKVYLAVYQGTSIMLVDSVQLNQGVGVIPSKNIKGPGLYKLYIDKDRHQDILLGDDYDMSITATAGDKLKINNVVGAKETVLFFQYESRLLDARNAMSSYRKQYTEFENNKDSVAAIRKRMNTLNERMKRFMQAQSSESNTLFYADFIKAAKSVGLPKSLYGNARKDTVLWSKQYNFMRNHFFDNIDFSNEGLVRSPILERNLDKYMKDILVPLPDSIGPALLMVIEKSKKNEAVYKYVANHLLTSSINSKIMGMDKVFVQIASQNQLRSGQTLLDSVNYKKVKDKVMAVMPVLVGAKAHNLSLQDSQDRDVSLYSQQGKYHVVVFWDPTCNHCKKVVPDLYQRAFTKYFGEGVDFMAVNTQQDVEKWSKFIKDQNIGQWINVYDKYGNSFMHHYYNITTTPKIYLLDHDMKIVAKDVGVDTLVDILDEKLN